MSLELGRKLAIRAMIYVAGKPVPFFWPMRAFIHHNPLHGLEHLPFDQAVREGERLFHGRGFLPRRQYQDYWRAGRIEPENLRGEISRAAADLPDLPGIDWPRWLTGLLTEFAEPITSEMDAIWGDDVQAVSQGATPRLPDSDALRARLRRELLEDRPLHEAVDLLYGSDLSAELDEALVKICLDFFDEGQSVWAMPRRRQGLFAAWRNLATRDIWPSGRSRRLKRLLAISAEPQEIIARVMDRLNVPEERWTRYFSRELARLHGWSGFIRWRMSAKNYYWQQRNPANLVDLLAIRLSLGLVMLEEQLERGRAADVAAIETLIQSRPEELYLRLELHGGKILPAHAQPVEAALARGRGAGLTELYTRCVRDKAGQAAARLMESLRDLAQRAQARTALEALSAEQLMRLAEGLHGFEQHEGMVWMRAMEARAMDDLLAGIQLTPPAARAKRPFVQALFCIDTRSERIRRHLEGVGDYQTYGIAGFFGVPVSFVEHGKGSENHLCPVLLTPKNLVLEMTTSAPTDPATVTALEHAMHELKESVLTPFVTVEAIGLLFGFDMVGKTVAPRGYHRWRKRLHQDKPRTHLLLDKLSEEQADSVVRAAQRAVIFKAVELELGLKPEQITDDMVRALREAAMKEPDPNQDEAVPLTCHWCNALGLRDGGKVFVKRLREAYHINPGFVRRQCQQLGRIGFTLDEQVGFVRQALRAIGLTQRFSRFVLLVGHGSSSENNPYESALDCGACGGSHGLVSARVLAQMANKPAVRARLREQGVTIPDDAWFIPALHNTTTDEIRCHDLERLPPSHLVYLDRLRTGLVAASRNCAQERVPELNGGQAASNPAQAALAVQKNALDWSQVRPEWGLSGNAFFIIGRRHLTQSAALDGRAFLHSYDYRLDGKRRLLENILTGPLVVGQWINMEHYFSTVDNQRFGSGSKVYHNVAGRFGVMTGNLSDLRTGLPAQTVLDRGRPHHQPIRLITLIEAPFEHARRAVEAVVSVKQLVRNGWIRLLILDAQAQTLSCHQDGDWVHQAFADTESLQQALNSEEIAA